MKYFKLLAIFTLGTIGGCIVSKLDPSGFLTYLTGMLVGFVLALELQQKISEGARAALELGALRNSCKHHAFTDVAGFPYDTRYCAVCGVSMGSV